MTPRRGRPFEPTQFKYPPDIAPMQALVLKADARRSLLRAHPELGCDLCHGVDIKGTGHSGTVVQLNSEPPRLFKVFTSINEAAYDREVSYAMMMQRLIPDHAVGFIGATKMCDGRAVAEMPCAPNAVDMYYAAKDKTLHCHHMISALDAVAGMHNAGYLHNDIKPENFLVLRECAKLIDFGTCLPIGATSRGGTTDFMHPRLSPTTSIARTVTTDFYAFAVTTQVSLDITIANAKRDTQADAATAYCTDSPIHRALAAAHSMVECAHCNPLLEYDKGEAGKLRAALRECVEWV